MKKLFFTLAIMFTISVAYSQSYKSAIGLRLGYPASISFKTFVSERGAFEGFVGFRRWSYVSYTNIGAMYQYHNPFPNVEGLAWYYGGGATVYFWNYDDDFFFNDDYNGLNFGIMGVLGLDYKFANAPVNLSIDWVPTFVIGDAYYGGFRGDAGALSVRYTFGSN